MGEKKDFNPPPDVIDAFEILWRKKWVILLPALFMALLVFLYLRIIPQDKFLVLEVDTADILKIRNEKGKEFFSIRDFNKLNKIEGFEIEIKKRTGSRNILLERQFIDSFIVEKIMEPGESPEKIISDYFHGIEARMFEQFVSGLKIKHMNDMKKIYQYKLNLKELLKKIEIVKKYLVKDTEIFITKTSMQQVFLPPFQQLNGYMINRDMVRSDIDKFSRKYLLSQKLLEAIEREKINTFRKLLNLSGIGDFREIFYKYESIPEKIDLFMEKYSIEYEIRSISQSWAKFTLLAVIFLLFFQSFMVLLYRLYKFHREAE